MVVLVLVGLLGGLITGISPCILPVLPVVLAAGATGAPTHDGTDSAHTARGRRSLAVIGGLVLSFSAVTLLGSWALSTVGLPQDLLRNIGLVALGIVGIGLIVPAIGDLLARPFARFGQSRARLDAGGFVLGLSLGLLYLPCAGPVLTAITVVGASHHLGVGAIVLTVAFAAGTAVPLLAVAFAGEQFAARLTAVRTHASIARKLAGGVLIIMALVIGLNLTDGLQRNVPGYTNALQRHISQNHSANAALGGATGRAPANTPGSCASGTATLVNCGRAPALKGISSWINTPGDSPLTLKNLKGRVVLVDFWTYSCINCQRALPHLEAWDRAYRDAGLTIIGVHTPEFAFEHVRDNVTTAAKQLGVQYPIALDNSYGTWDAYGNQYWPAEYLIDATGTIRHVEFGEGSYRRTESFIRTLLTQAKPQVTLPKATSVGDTTPTENLTPETYVGSERLTNPSMQSLKFGQTVDYTLPAVIPKDGLVFGGRWNIDGQYATAGTSAKLALRYQAANVFAVLGGKGTVDVSVDGVHTRTVHLDDEPRLYPLVSAKSNRRATLHLEMSSGVKVYSFTFG